MIATGARHDRRLHPAAAIWGVLFRSLGWERLQLTRSLGRATRSVSVITDAQNRADVTREERE